MFPSCQTFLAKSKILLSLLFTLWGFFISDLADGLSQKFDSKSPQVSMRLLSILADLNNPVVYMASTRPLISKSSSPCINPLVTVPRAPIKISISITFMFHSFLNSLARSWYLSFFSLFFSVLFSDQPGQQSPQFCKFSFFVYFYKV